MVRDEDKAEYIASQLGSGIESELGSGFYGVAYELEDGTVLKKTRSYSEAVCAARVNGEDLASITNIYGVIEVKNDSGSEFYIHQEKVETEGETFEHLNSAYEFFADHLISVYDYYDEDEINETDLETIKLMRYDQIFLALQESMYIHEIKGSAINDVHEKNIGIKRVNATPIPVVFDCMDKHLEEIILANESTFDMAEYIQEDKLERIMTMTASELYQNIEAFQLEQEELENEDHLAFSM